MSSRHSRLTRSLLCSAASLFAGALFMACSAGGQDSVAQTSEAVKTGNVFHSHVDRGNWRHNVGHRHHDDHGCRPKSLDLCPTFDSDFIGVDAGASCAHITTPECPDRVDTWDSTIVFDFAIA